MKKILSLILFLFPISGLGMTMDQFQINKKQAIEKIELLKKALFDKTAPEAVQTIIGELEPLIQSNISMWNEVLKPQKAILIGNAESAARVVDLQVQNLARAHKAISAELQQQHANARTNVHLIKDFLYPYDSGAPYGVRRGGRR